MTADGLTRFWRLVGSRLERNGVRANGRLTIDGLDRDERHALAGLVGRPVSSDRLSVDLAALDARIRSSGVASGLVALVERNTGALVDRVGQRREQADARQAQWQSARSALVEAGLEGRDWAVPWLDDVRRAGALGRLSPTRAADALVTAVHCVAQLPGVNGDADVARGDLASRVAGNAHALDDGTVLASVVLRAAAVVTGAAYPTTPAERRALWRAVGVQTDEVSTTALTIGLRTTTGGTWLDDRSCAGWETHLTLRDLRRVDLAPPLETGTVFVCENPRVLEMALDAGSRAAGVCTQGQPAVVVTTLLRRLRVSGADLRYHGDFDWAGVTIANAMVAVHGCTAWRMSAADYLAAVARVAPLVGELPELGAAPVDATWDDRLTPAMVSSGRAIHEELVLVDLLADMTGEAD